VAQGRARLVYRHMAFLGEESVAAAAASGCAQDQGRFWDYHDRLLAAQGGRNAGAFSPANLRAYAAEIGLQAEPFGECVDSGKYLARARAETETGKQKGVTSTPTIFVNGEKLERGASLADILNRVDLLAPVPPAPSAPLPPAVR
jgi:protein-disulfide isomerase